MERVESTIQKPLAGALLLFAGSCAIVMGACLVLTLVAEGFRGGAGLNATARWVLDWCSWICAFAVIATTSTLVGVVRQAAVRETNVLAAMMLASFNLVLVAGMFALLLLGLRGPSQAGWPGARALPARPGAVGAVLPAAPNAGARLARQGRAVPGARMPGRSVSR